MKSLATTKISENLTKTQTLAEQLLLFLGNPECKLCFFL